MKKETQMMVELLNSTVSATSPLSVATEIEVLELLNIVNDPALIEKMKSFSRIIPAGTPATLTGLLQLLRNMMHSSPKATDDHRKSVDEIFMGLDAVPNVNLTFGTFMAICKTILEKHPHHQ